MCRNIKAYHNEKATVGGPGYSATRSLAPPPPAELSLGLARGSSLAQRTTSNVIQDFASHPKNGSSYLEILLESFGSRVYLDPKSR